jgi:hypothetical protein
MTRSATVYKRAAAALLVAAAAATVTGCNRNGDQQAPAPKVSQAAGSDATLAKDPVRR